MLGARLTRRGKRNWCPRADFGSAECRDVATAVPSDDFLRQLIQEDLWGVEAIDGRTAEQTLILIAPRSLRTRHSCAIAKACPWQAPQPVGRLRLYRVNR